MNLEMASRQQLFPMTEDRHRKIMTVLLLASQRELGLFRIHALEGAGFHVLFPAGHEEARKAIQAGGFNVVLLSYSIADKFAREFMDLIRQTCPACPVVAISKDPWNDTKLQPDATVLADQGPEAMVEAVKNVTQRGMRRVK